MPSQSIQPDTFLGRIRNTILARGDATAVTYLVDGEEEGDRLTYTDIDTGAKRVAATLQASGVRAGDRVILLESPGPRLVAGFLGCVYAGAIAVPAYPPSPFLGAGGVRRLRGLFADSEPSAVLTSSALLEAVRSPDVDSTEIRWLDTDGATGTASAYDFDDRDPTPQDLVFLQYTSGSTTTPRGVRVTQGALATNLEQLERRFGFSAETIGCSWLPAFHDMGLIAMLLLPLTTGFPVVQMTPEAFLRRPERWLRAITRYGATFSAAPDFAYELCVHRVRDHASLDLSSWTRAVNGAEPVRAQTLSRFADAFADCGFSAEAFWPGYGLAEATLGVALPNHGGATVIHVDAASLGAGRLEPKTGPGSKPVVSCGQALSGTAVSILDEAGSAVPEGVVGEIEVTGPNVCDGYWNRPDLNAKVFPEGRLLTGDLGVMWRGQLFVTGRIKDLLIVRGRNLYPHDLEQTMNGSDPDLRPGRGVAVSVPSNDGDLLVLIQEPSTPSPEDPERIIGRLQRLVTEQHGVSPDVIVLIQPGTLPKTTSGKHQRSAAAQMFIKDELKVVSRWNAPRIRV